MRSNIENDTHSKYSSEYLSILNDAANWPAWKVDYYNSCFATSAHAKKINQNDMNAGGDQSE